MERFRIDSINQMAIKQIAAVQLSDGDGPFVLGRPDPQLQGVAPDQHPLTEFLQRLMHDEPLDVEAQNGVAALGVQVVHFGDLEAILQHVYAAVLAEGRPQHVVTLKMNKVLRDVLHLAHAHQEDFQKVFAGADVQVGSAAVGSVATGSGGGGGALPPKPPPEKQRVIMVQDEPGTIPAGHWSRQVSSSQAHGSAGASGLNVGERKTAGAEPAGFTPVMVTLLANLVAVPISIAAGTMVGLTKDDSTLGWQAFFLVLLPSLVIVSFVGAIAHWVWKYVREESS